MKSQFVRRPFVSQLFLNLMNGFFQILVFASSGPYGLRFFESLKTFFFYEFYSFSLTWDPIAAKILKRYSSYKSQPNVLKLVLNFPPNSPYKNSFRTFEMLSF